MCPVPILSENPTYEELCAYKTAKKIDYQIGTILHRFIRNNDISTDIKKIEDEDILDVTFKDVVYDDEKSGTCTSAVYNNGKDYENIKDILNNASYDTINYLCKSEWKMFSSRKVE